MESLNESHVLEMLQNMQSNDEQTRLIASQYLQEFTYKLEFIPFFYNLLRHCLENKLKTSAYFILLIFRDVMVNRGVLLALDQNQAHISNLLEIADNFANLIASDYAIRNIFSDALAISYRFVIEITKSAPLPFADLFMIYKKSNDHKVIAINTMYSVMNCLENNMKHVSNELHRLLIRQFCQYLIQDYFQCSFVSILDSNQTVNEIGVNLLYKCITFFPNSQKKPRFLHEFFETPKYVDVLLNYYMRWKDDTQNSQQASKTLETLSYYVKMSREYVRNNILNEAMNKISMIIQDIINSQTNNDVNYSDILQFLIDITEFDDFYRVKCIETFLGVVIPFTDNYIHNNPDNFILLWKKISKISDRGSDFPKPELVNDVLLQIYSKFLMYLFFSCEKSSELYFNNYDYGIKILSNAWKMVRNQIVNASDLICNQSEEILNNGMTEESYQKMIIIVMATDALIQCYSSCSTDYERAVSNILPKIVKFIIFEIQNQDLVLNNYHAYGLIVPKVEFLFITLTDSFLKYICRNKANICANNIIRKIDEFMKQFGSGYSNNIFVNFLLDHMIDNLLIFKDCSNITFGIINFLSNSMIHGINNENSFSFSNASIVSTNKKIVDLSYRKIVFNFEDEYASFNDLKKYLPLLYNIYGKVIKDDEWDGFLNLFDQEFDRIRENSNPKSCFILYRKIRGILIESRNNEIALNIFKWMLFTHLEDTKNMLKNYHQYKFAVNAIIKSWYELYKRNIFRGIENTGLGILYFKANVQILLTLKEFCEDSQWQAMKIIYNSIINEYANFGIMSLYKDNSLQIVLDIFFSLVQNWAIGETPKRLMRITQTLSKIIEIGVADNMIISNDIILTICEFLIQNLLVHNEETWTITCQCISKLLQKALEYSVPMQKFMQFFIVIFDALINLSFTDPDMISATAETIRLLIMHNFDQCMKVSDAVLSTFEQKYVEDVRKIFHNFLKAADNENDNSEKHFHGKLKDFSNDMKRYHVEIANIPIFTGIFRRSE